MQTVIWEPRAMAARPLNSVDDEYDDIVALLMDHRVDDSAATLRLCHAIALASMGENHLWQDMKLPSRNELTALLRAHFPALVALNVGDMKWKKFFYRQLCARAEIPICKSPHCAECCDYAVCFGPET
jgi:nitrogen fixation protein NifQ